MPAKLTKEPRTFHIHIPLATLLAKTDVELSEVLASTLSPAELRKELLEMQVRGMLVFTGSDCESQDAQGYCEGHPSQRETAMTDSINVAVVEADVGDFASDKQVDEFKDKWLG